jgi:hypothetical protein
MPSNCVYAKGDDQTRRQHGNNNEDVIGAIGGGARTDADGDRKKVKPNRLHQVVDSAPSPFDDDAEGKSLRSFFAVDHPRYAKPIDKHAETGGPKSLLDRHLHRAFFRQCVKYAFRFCRVIDAEGDGETF